MIKMTSESMARAARMLGGGVAAVCVEAVCVGAVCVGGGGGGGGAGWATAIGLLCNAVRIA